jgi:hypothetical protein
MIVELIVAFDEVISLGHNENVVLGQMKQYVEMESPEERLHKLVIENKISDPTQVIFLSWVCFGVVLHHLPDDLPLIAISGQWKPYYPCVNIAIAVCSNFA